MSCVQLVQYLEPNGMWLVSVHEGPTCEILVAGNEREPEPQRLAYLERFAPGEPDGGILPLRCENALHLRQGGITRPTHGHRAPHRSVFTQPRLGEDISKYREDHRKGSRNLRGVTMLAGGSSSIRLIAHPSN